MALFEDNFKQFEDWIKDFENLSKQTPEIFRIYELSKLNKTTLENTPDDNSRLYNNLYQNFNDGLSILIPALPKIEPINQFVMMDSSIAMTSGATASYSEIQAYIPLSTKETTWKYKTLDDYNTYFKSNDYINSIISFFDNIGSLNLKAEFLDLVDQYKIYKSGDSDHVSFGFKLRNFIEGFKGILKKAADIEKFGAPKGDHHLSWPKVAAAIALKSKSNIAEKEIVRMGSIWVENHSFLSNKSKKYFGNDYENYCACYNTCISMVYTFTKVVDINKIKIAI
jgi:hypothetical protein